MPAYEHFIQGFKLYLRPDLLPEFVIRISGHEWRVHSRVVSEQSAFFEKVCKGPFRESSNKEVILHDDSPWLVARMIRYLYFGMYHIDNAECLECGKCPTCDVDCVNWKPTIVEMMMIGGSTSDYTALQAIEDDLCLITLHCEMYNIGDKYDIPGLRAETINNLIMEEDYTEAECIAAVKTIGFEVLDREQDLRKYLIRQMCDGSKIGWPAFQRFEELLKADERFAMDVIHILEHEGRYVDFRDDLRMFWKDQNEDDEHEDANDDTSDDEVDESA